MNTEKFKKELVRFFSNPNTLTFIFAIVAILILYYVYAYMVNNAIQPTTLYYATSTLYESDRLTKDKIGSIEVSGSFLTSQGGNIAQNYNMIYDKFVKKGYRIPANSFFYTEALTSEDAADSTPFTLLDDNFTIYKLKTDFHKTLGCSIMDGDYIDLYVKTKTDDGKLIYTLFIKSIQVLMVVNSEGQDVFAYTKEDESLKPAMLYFAVPIETYKMLSIADKPGTNFEFIPVARDNSYSENPEEPHIVNEQIKDMIFNKANTLI